MVETGMVDTSNAIQRKAFDLYGQLQTAIKEQARLFLVVGKILKQIRDEKLYRQIGEGGYDTFHHFLNNPEIGIPQSTAYLYIRVYEYYVFKLKMLEAEIIAIPINRLMKLLPALKKKEDEEAKALISSIGFMTNTDYGKEIEEKKLGSDRPRLYHSNIEGKWIFEFKEEQVEKIINKTKGEIIFPIVEKKL